VVEAAGLPAALARAALVLTGEGRVDGQTVFGKGPIEVAHHAAEAGVPVALLAGTLGPGWRVVLDEGVTLVEEVSAGIPLEQAMRQTPALLRAAAARAVSALLV
jgi:glycerate 2-kinase